MRCRFSSPFLRHLTASQRYQHRWKTDKCKRKHATERLKIVNDDGVKEVKNSRNKVMKKSKQSEKLRFELKKHLSDLQKKLSNEKKRKEEFEAENERLSLERDKTLADLGPWKDQISRHEQEISFASFFKEAMCEVLEEAREECLDAQKRLADIQSKNLSTMDMQAELENNKLGPSQIAVLNCARDCLQALVDERDEIISKEQKSIDELAQASKQVKDKVSELHDKITNGVGEMLRSRNKITNIEKAIFKTEKQINLVKIDKKFCKKLLRKAKRGD